MVVINCLGKFGALSRRHSSRVQKLQKYKKLGQTARTKSANYCENRNNNLIEKSQGTCTVGPATDEGPLPPWWQTWTSSSAVAEKTAVQGGSVLGVWWVMALVRQYSAPNVVSARKLKSIDVLHDKSTFMRKTVTLRFCVFEPLCGKGLRGNVRCSS